MNLSLRYRILYLLMGVFSALLSPLGQAQNDTGVPPIDGEANKNKSVVTESYTKYLKKIPQGASKFKHFDKKVSEFLNLVSKEWSECKKSQVRFNSISDLFSTLIFQNSTTNSIEIINCNKGQEMGELKIKSVPSCNTLSPRSLILLKNLTKHKEKLEMYLYEVEEISLFQSEMIQLYFLKLAND